MNLLRQTFRISWGIIVLAILAGIVSGACSVGLLALIDAALEPAQGSETSLILGFVGLCLVVLVSKIISHLLLNLLWQRGVFQLYTDLSERITATPLRRLEEIGPHRLLAVLTEDIQAIAQALLGVPTLCINLAIVICCLAYLGWLSLTVLLAVLAFLLIGVLTYQLLVSWALRYLQQARTQQDLLLKHFQGLTAGIKELKMHVPRQAAFLEEIWSTAHRLRTQNLAGMSVYAVAGSWGHILFFAVLGLLLFALPRGNELSVPILAGATLTVLYTVAPLEGIMAWLPALGRAGVALRHVETLALALEADREPAAAARPFSGQLQSLTLAGVCHAYHRENEEGGFLLGPVNLTLRSGEVVFLVGGNGSGKTTLVKILTGLYLPKDGEISLNGIPLTPETLPSYRQMFSVVFADYYLFDNFPGLDIARMEPRMQAYLKLLELDRKVQIKGGRLTTLDLSMGQRKRLALLTAYLEDRPVYVFDEWACDQDPRFKEIFYCRLVPELRAQGKTVLVVSHDDLYFETADRIIKLEYGKLLQGEFEDEVVRVR